jgi:hypothetical protein
MFLLSVYELIRIEMSKRGYVTEGNVKATEKTTAFVKDGQPRPARPHLLFER